VRRAGQSNADIVADTALRWLAARPRGAAPFLLWLHFYDPHHPYTPPDGVPPFGDTDLDRYDAEVVFVDRAIDRILDSLDRSGLASSTVVAFTSDHGDEFNEHGLRFHARSLYNQVVRIPLVVRLPRAPASVIDTPVSIVDVMPTLLDLVDQPAPAGLNGRSLGGAIRGTGPPPARPVLLELAPDRSIHRNLAAVVTGDAKAIWDREANAWSLYARADSADATDRSTTDPATLTAMQRQLLLLLDTELAAWPR
jgi:arylsulfatase A-like enzyme